MSLQEIIAAYGYYAMFLTVLAAGALLGLIGYVRRKRREMRP